MKLAFTICSNNYLAQAKTLGDSLLLHNPDYKFVIGLVDHMLDTVDYSFFRPYEIIPISEIGIAAFDEIWRKYNIVELNTAVKPSFFKYLKSKYPGAAFLYYFDPDIQIFHRLHALEAAFDHADILLTPHVVTPIPLDGLFPGENTFLNFGIYNLGFAGISTRSATSASMLDWWEERTLTSGYIDQCNGIFVDQLWMNHVPLFFEKVQILREYGYNAGPWNLHERKQVTRQSENYIMKDGSTLVFYHFSSYDPSKPGQISKTYNRYTFENCPDIVGLYKQYHELLIKNKIEEFKQVTCYYVQARKDYLDSRTKKAGSRQFNKDVKAFARLLIPPVVPLAIRKIQSAFKPVNPTRN